MSWQYGSLQFYYEIKEINWKKKHNYVTPSEHNETPTAGKFTAVQSISSS